MKRSLLVFAIVLTAAAVAGQTRTSKTLDIYVIDVEGGNATLFVPPSGESLLIDTGNGGAAAARDGTHYGRDQRRRRSSDRPTHYDTLAR